MKRFSVFMIITVFTLVLAACGSGESSADNPNGETDREKVTITHKLGETVVAKNPENIVVFDFGILDTLDALGIDVVGLPKSNIPTYLEKFSDDKYVNLGSLKEPDFDKLSELDPDLIVISSRQAKLYDEFKKLGPTVYMEVDPTDYLQSFIANSEAIGEIFGLETEVAEKLSAINESINQLKEEAQTIDGKGLVILANDGKMSAYGANSRFGIIHDVFGIAQVDENIEVSTHGQGISFEYIVDKDPDYLFVVDRGAVVGGESSAKQVVENDLVKNTRAYKNDRVVYLDPNYWYLSGGGFVSVTEMIKEIENGIK